VRVRVSVSVLEKENKGDTQMVGSYYPNGGKLLHKWWGATTQMVGSYYPNGGELLPKWWEATP
jgi:hypothetical protein